MNIGDAFLMPTPPNGNHLFFAIATTAKNKYLCVSTTTLKPSSDKACILVPGAGVPDFIVHESSVAYKHAREISTAVYARLVSNGEISAKGSCSADVLEEIQKGALVSRQISKRYKQTVKDFLDGYDPSR